MNFETGNAAFEDSPELEVEYLLHKVARTVRAGGREGPVIDSNGNTIGSWKLQEEDA
jgi:hypothetical protein